MRTLDILMSSNPVLNVSVWNVWCEVSFPSWEQLHEAFLFYVLFSDWIQHIWVFHDRRFCQIIWQIFTRGRAEKIHQFIIHCPKWGLKPGPRDLQTNALPTELGRNQEISEVSFVCFMHHFTCWTLFISRINRAWLYKGHEDSCWQLNVDLAQLVRHWPEDPEIQVSNPIFDEFFLLFRV